MKVSWNWLCELLEIPSSVTPQAVADRLSVSGVAVDALHPIGKGLSGVICAEVRGKRPHPKADKLTLVDVFDGKEVTQVVCGAPNVPNPGEPGRSPRVLWAKPGATLPNGLVLSVREVRGIPSPGMLCAEDELGLSEDHDGIVILSPDDGIDIGGDVAQAAGLPDWVFELDITPNRPDLLGHTGVAREIAALFRHEGVRLRQQSVNLAALRGNQAQTEPAQIVVEDSESCPRYLGHLIRGVKVGKSPLFYRLRLQRLGVRALSNVVDATNLALLQYGHPLHAFDLHKLAGQKIVVRRAKPEEKIKTLDGQEREVGPSDLLIADAEKGVAVAGVMGGQTSEVGESTTDVLLECAYFAPAMIRRTAKKLKLHTEASHRFERGTDANAIPEVADACAALIVKLAGGQLAAAATDVYPKKLSLPTLTLRPERTTAMLGLTISAAMQKECLEAIGLPVHSDGKLLTVEIPTRRPDLTREIDLIEEVARVYGLHHIPTTLPNMPMSEPQPPSVQMTRYRNADRARMICASLGLLEVIQFSMTSPDRVKLGEGRRELAPLCIENPLREELSVLRSKLLPGLVELVRQNLSHGQTDLRLFEVGEVFQPSGANEVLPTEQTHVAAVLCGHRDHFLKPTPGDALDFYDAKGLVEQLVAGLGLSLVWQPDPSAGARAVFVRAATADEAPMLHPGAAAALCFAHSGAVIGTFGELHPDLRSKLDLPGAAFALELAVPDLPISKPNYVAHSRFPATSRDLSFFVAQDVSAAALLDAMQKSEEPLLRDVALLEDYRAQGHVPAGQKALLFSLTYQSDQRTLTDDEVQKAHQKVIDQLGKKVPIALRQ
ncbi:MAG TPA: phenylalanine--tRNA ligase subunit beta [Pseudomonadota bacterium]|nr:phenylalanine--tRNA ligase subunit beta [Pseudomonadota bacterium]